MDTNIQRLNAQLEKECPVCHNDMVLPTIVPDCGHTFCFICIKGVSMQNMGGCPICRGPIDQEIFNKPKATIDLKMAVPDSPAPATVTPPMKKRRTDEEAASPSSPTGNSDNLKAVKDEPVDEDEKKDDDVKPDLVALRAKLSARIAQKSQNQVVPPAEKNYWLYHGRKSGWWRFDPRTEKDIEEASSNGMPITEVVVCGKRYIIDFTQMVQYPKDTGLVYKRDVKRVTSGEFDAMNVKGVAGLLARR